MNSAAKSLRVLLGVGALYHLLLGLAGLFMKDQAAELARLFFRFNLSPTPEILWLLNPFSAYLLAFGLLMAVTALDPVKYRAFVYVVVTLYAVRVLERIWFLVAGEEALRVAGNPVQQAIHLGVVVIMAGAMLVLASRSRAAP